MLSAVEGNYISPAKTLKIVFHGLFEDTQSITINSKSLRLTKEMNQFFAAMEKYDPFSDPERAPEEPVHVVEVDYTLQEVTLTW